MRDAVGGQDDVVESESSDTTVLRRLVLDGDVERNALKLTIAFATYHSVKFGHSALAFRAGKTRDFEELANVTIGNAKAFAIKFARQGVCYQWQPSSLEEASA